MLLNRHRIAKLIELTDLERRLTGPERMLREEDVALLVKAAYDDATDAARAAFMARVQSLPVTAWPWSAVQVKAARSAVHGDRTISFQIKALGDYTRNLAERLQPGQAVG